jgi:hypothetical protein
MARRRPGLSSRRVRFGVGGGVRTGFVSGFRPQGSGADSESILCVRTTVRVIRPESPLCPPSRSDAAERPRLPPSSPAGGAAMTRWRPALSPCRGERGPRLPAGGDSLRLDSDLGPAYGFLAYGFRHDSEQLQVVRWAQMPCPLDSTRMPSRALTASRPGLRLIGSDSQTDLGPG